MIQVNYKDRSFIVEEMTEEDKEILQAEKPELYRKHFNKIKVKNKPIKNYNNGMYNSNHGRHH